MLDTLWCPSNAFVKNAIFQDLSTSNSFVFLLPKFLSHFSDKKRYLLAPMVEDKYKYYWMIALQGAAAAIGGSGRSLSAYINYALLYNIGVDSCIGFLNYGRLPMSQIFYFSRFCTSQILIQNNKKKAGNKWKNNSSIQKSITHTLILEAHALMIFCKTTENA